MFDSFPVDGCMSGCKVFVSFFAILQGQRNVKKIFFLYCFLYIYMCKGQIFYLFTLLYNSNDNYLCICNLFQIFPDKAATRSILNLNVYCSYKAQGCLWFGELRHLKAFQISFYNRYSIYKWCSISPSN